VAGDSSTIRIGTVGIQTATFTAGIYGADATGGTAVFVTPSGKLGTTMGVSSQRFKEDIRDIAEESDGLMRLRPVAFKYQAQVDPTGLTQYGLIAEEVAEVYPDLVACGRDGKPETVRYHLVNALLLNELQKQHRNVERQQKANEAQEKTIEQQKAEIEALEARLSKLEARLLADSRP
jgi:predicted ribosome quality control (RQC) complex YloA/Tae2 family protein